MRFLRLKTRTRLTSFQREVPLSHCVHSLSEQTSPPPSNKKSPLISYITSLFRISDKTSIHNTCNVSFRYITSMSTIINFLPDSEIQRNWCMMMGKRRRHVPQIRHEGSRTMIKCTLYFYGSSLQNDKQINRTISHNDSHKNIRYIICYYDFVCYD